MRPYTAPIGKLVEIALPVRRHGSLALSLYRRASRPSSSIWPSLLIFSLALPLSYETRFVSAGLSLSAFCLVFACSALDSALDSAPVSALDLSHLCLGYASCSSRATSTSVIKDTFGQGRRQDFGLGRTFSKKLFNKDV